jgi:hypothetical protein
MKPNTEQQREWLEGHDYVVAKVGDKWTVSDPLDDAEQGYKLTLDTEAEVVAEAYQHLNNDWIGELR